MEVALLELSIVMLVAATLGYIARMLRQPPILGYILAGFLLANLFLGHVGGITETLELFSTLGVAFLLFMLGLELNVRELKEVGLVSVIIGVGQVLVTSSIGIVLAKFVFGYDWVEASYIAVALTFSSTIIILKLLGEKGDINSLYGRIAVGMLIVQDLIAILALIALTSISGVSEVSGSADIMLLVGQLLVFGVLLVIFALIIGRILSTVLSYIGKATELIVLAIIGYALMFSMITQSLGFSIEVGAFLAGLAMAASPLNIEIAAKIKPLRDFFIITFFIMLGMSFTTVGLLDNVWQIVFFSGLVIIGNPLILLSIMGVMGYHRRVSFLAGLTVSQISEFSLILVATGVTLGQVTDTTLSMVTGVGIVTLVGSSYLITHGEDFYLKLSKPLKIFQRNSLVGGKTPKYSKKGVSVLLFGAHRMGKAIIKRCKDQNVPLIAIDFDPVTVRRLTEEGVPAIYGDLSDPDFVDELEIGDADIVISTIPVYETNLLLLARLREISEKITIIVRAENREQANEMKEHGATNALIPEELAGIRVVHLLERHGILEKISKTKQN